MPLLARPLAAALLAAPFALAFFSGGFFDVPRLVAAVATMVAAGLCLIVCPRPLPHSAGGLLVLGGLAALTGLTIASVGWAPIDEAASDDAQRLLLYLAAAVVAVAVLRDRRAASWVGPAVVAGVAVVCLYALGGRLLPGLIEQSTSLRAGGRLEQPLTYWNAMGLLAAIGLIFGARLLGDVRRSPATAVLAAASSPVLGAALYLTFSRGGLVALAVGMGLLIALVRERGQAIAAAAVVAGGAGGAVACAVLPAVADPVDAAADTIRTQGVIATGLLALVVLGAAVAGWLLARRPAEPRTRPLPGSTRAWRLGTAAVVVAGVVGAGLAAQSAETGKRAVDPAFGAQNQRLASVESLRYSYWEVALSAFAEHPVAGVGSGGFRAEWLRERPEPEPAADAHSLYLETLAELGLLGAAALAAVIAGIVLAGRTALRVDPGLAAGPLAVLAAWGTHAALDWDWEMPTLGLLALICAGLVVATAERQPGTPDT
ncbi:MAG: O-antigen ligase family protein [Solirubrobacterales bacterium]